MAATIKAVDGRRRMLSKWSGATGANGYVVTHHADHGNADTMVDDTGGPLDVAHDEPVR